MAKLVVTTLVDDIDGTEATETVTFTVDGVAYEIDLSTKNAAAFHKALAPYIEHGSRVGGRKPATKTRTRSEDSAAVRAWARENGHEVTERGRIPQAARDAYDAAMRGKAA